MRPGSEQPAPSVPRNARRAVRHVVARRSRALAACGACGAARGPTPSSTGIRVAAESTHRRCAASWCSSTPRTGKERRRVAGGAARGARLASRRRRDAGFGRYSHNLGANRSNRAAPDLAHASVLRSGIQGGGCRAAWVALRRRRAAVSDSPARAFVCSTVQMAGIAQGRLQEERRSWRKVRRRRVCPNALSR